MREARLSLLSIYTPQHWGWRLDTDGISASFAIEIPSSTALAAHIRGVLPHFPWSTQDLPQRLLEETAEYVLKPIASAAGHTPASVVVEIVPGFRYALALPLQAAAWSSGVLGGSSFTYALKTGTNASEKLSLELRNPSRFVYVASSPTDQQPLDVRAELAMYAGIVEQTGMRVESHIHGITPAELCGRIAEIDEPFVLHVSAHGNQDGVALEGPFGTSESLTFDALSDAIQQRGLARLVVVSACHGLTDDALDQHLQATHGDRYAWADTSISPRLFKHFATSAVRIAERTGADVIAAPDIIDDAFAALYAQALYRQATVPHMPLAYAAAQAAQQALIAAPWARRDIIPALVLGQGRTTSNVLIDKARRKPRAPRAGPFVPEFSAAADTGALSAILRHARSRVSTIAVVGPPGSGKSRLLQQAQSQLAFEKVPVTLGVVDPPTPAVDFSHLDRIEWGAGRPQVVIAAARSAAHVPEDAYIIHLDNWPFPSIISMSSVVPVLLGYGHALSAIVDFGFSLPAVVSLIVDHADQLLLGDSPLLRTSGVTDLGERWRELRGMTTNQNPLGAFLTTFVSWIRSAVERLTNDERRVLAAVAISGGWGGLIDVLWREHARQDTRQLLPLQPVGDALLRSGLILPPSQIGGEDYRVRVCVRDALLGERLLEPEINWALDAAVGTLFSSSKASRDLSERTTYQRNALIFASLASDERALIASWITNDGSIAGRQGIEVAARVLETRGAVTLAANVRNILTLDFSDPIAPPGLLDVMGKFGLKPSESTSEEISPESPNVVARLVMDAYEHYEQGDYDGVFEAITVAYGHSDRTPLENTHLEVIALRTSAHLESDGALLVAKATELFQVTSSLASEGSEQAAVLAIEVAALVSTLGDPDLALSYLERLKSICGTVGDELMTECHLPIAEARILQSLGRGDDAAWLVRRALAVVYTNVRCAPSLAIAAHWAAVSMLDLDRFDNNVWLAAGIVGVTGCPELTDSDRNTLLRALATFKREVAAMTSEDVIARVRAVAGDDPVAWLDRQGATIADIEATQDTVAGWSTGIEQYSNVWSDLAAAEEVLATALVGRKQAKAMLELMTELAPVGTDLVVDAWRHLTTQEPSTSGVLEVAVAAERRAAQPDELRPLPEILLGLLPTSEHADALVLIAGVRGQLRARVAAVAAITSSNIQGDFGPWRWLVGVLLNPGEIKALPDPEELRAHSIHQLMMALLATLIAEAVATDAPVGEPDPSLLRRLNDIAVQTLDVAVSNVSRGNMDAGRVLWVICEILSVSGGSATNVCQWLLQAETERHDYPREDALTCGLDGLERLQGPLTSPRFAAGWAKFLGQSDIPGAHDRAHALLQRAHRQNPTDLALLHDFAMSLLDRKAFDEALALVPEGVVDPFERQIRALALLPVDPASAATEFEMLVDCDDPRLAATARANLGSCYFDAGRRADACAWVKALLNGNDRYAHQAAVSLASLFAQDGDHVTARELATLALAATDGEVAAMARRVVQGPDSAP